MHGTNPAMTHKSLKNNYPYPRRNTAQKTKTKISVYLLVLIEMKLFCSRMDPRITKLSNAENTAQVKAAVDDIPREKTYYAAELRDLILQKRLLIVNAPSADSVVSVLRDFSLVESARDLLRTAEIRDLIIDVLAPKISPGDPVENLGRTICNIVDDKSEGELYSNRKSFFAILDCFHRATTTESSLWIAGSIYNICFYNPGANKILNDLPVVEAYSAIIPHGTTDESVGWISNSIFAVLYDTVPAQKNFYQFLFLFSL